MLAEVLLHVHCTQLSLLFPLVRYNANNDGAENPGTCTALASSCAAVIALGIPEFGPASFAVSQWQVLLSSLVKCDSSPQVG